MRVRRLASRRNYERKPKLPNGKGNLECSYCEHWQSVSGERGYFFAYKDGYCTLHEVSISGSLPNWIHRVCLDFSPAEEFAKDNQIGLEWQPLTLDEVVAKRFTQMGISLSPNVLYGFFYSDPTHAWVIMNLPPAIESSGEE